MVIAQELHMLHVFNDQLAIAGTLVREDLVEIAKRGYRTLVDLRTACAPAAGGLKPEEVRHGAIRRGFVYCQLPISLTALDDVVIARVRRTLQEAATPVLVHCVSGRCAGALALVHLACEQGWTAAQYFHHLRALGLHIETLPPVCDVLMKYVARHSPAYRDNSAIPEQEVPPPQGKSSLMKFDDQNR
jgi:uncharacterized protein (TIGR01244 family)